MPEQLADREQAHTHPELKSLRGMNRRLSGLEHTGHPPCKWGVSAKGMKGRSER